MEQGKEGKKRGRPPLNDLPMTAAERKQKQRVKLAGAGAKTFSIVISNKAAEIINRYCEITGISRLEHVSLLAEQAIEEWAVLTEPSLSALAECAERRNESLKNKEVKK
jgi:hypothetical protein